MIKEVQGCVSPAKGHFTMAANPIRGQRAREERCQKHHPYDLVSGILALFSLMLLLPFYFRNASSKDKTV
jgi:hypothetical protein